MAPKTEKPKRDLVSLGLILAVTLGSLALALNLSWSLRTESDAPTIVGCVGWWLVFVVAAVETVREWRRKP